MSKTAFLQEHQRPGEVYAGLILGHNDEPDYHLFFSIPDCGKLNWKSAINFAKKHKLALPNRRELRLFCVNAGPQLKEGYYWSGEQYGSAYAWYQNFTHGVQCSSLKGNELRVVLVRRVPIGEK